MIWAEVKHSLNSSVGTNDHKPLDQVIKRNAYEAFYDVADYYNSITNNEGVVIVPRGKNEIVSGEFYNDGSETQIVILPWGLNTIGDDAFYGCRQLRKIFIPNTVKNIKNGAFTRCIALTSISIPNSVDAISETAFVGMHDLTNIYIDRKESDVPVGAPWGATNATIYYRT